MEERTIDLFDMMCWLIKKWWIIVLIALLGCALGIVAGAYKNDKYNKDMESERLEKQEAIDFSNVDEENIDAIFLSVLSSTEIETVKRVINNETFLKERKDYLEKIGKIEKLDPEQYWYVHSIEDSIVSTRATISKDKESFTDNMELYYKYLAGTDQNFDMSELSDLADTEQEVYVPKPLLNKKYAVLGFAAGLFVTVCAFAVAYILDSKIRTCDDIKAMFGVNVIGHIGGKHGKNNLSEEESVSLVCSSIALRLKKDNISEITVMGCNMELGQKKYSEIIARNLKNIKISIADKAIYDSKELVKLEDAAHVVLLEKANKTTCREIEEEVNLCKESGIEVVGIVFIA